ncbi:MAG TPA: phosphoribosylamine--glycine ligase [Candidatus Cybelea sp.]|nr:phosphoribosylamine--glycine ligase [Candidatus Cybelea sp.]
MNVLVVGSGGREHALCWAIAASPLVDQLYCAPGNGGIEAVARCIDIDALDFDGLIGFCRSESIDFVVVGPESPLCAGIVDVMEAAGIKTFGPSKAAAELEGSKGFMKDLCARHGIPTAAYSRFTDAKAAKDFIRANGAPIVVKADGLAAGKGVVVARSLSEANAAVDNMLGGQFGKAGAQIVIEEFLDGEEVSVFALVDGSHVLPLASAQDHKRAFDGDKGPNTGGMGAYSPAPAMTPALEAEVLARIIRPTVAAMAAEGRPYKGVLYAGIMLTAAGPKIYEYNVRFGDPETQVLMPRLKSDLLPALMAARDGVLRTFDLRWREEAALCVILATKGYPGDYAKGSVIGNLEPAGELPGVVIFHSGTKRLGKQVLANGGRVLGVTAVGASIAEAQSHAYEAVDVIDWPQGFCRRDIGWRALKR